MEGKRTMKSRMLSVLLGAGLLLSVCGTPCLAAEPAALRLTGAELLAGGETAVRYTFRYPEGGVLPGEEQIEYLTTDADGYTYTYTYDGAGRLIQSYGYAAGAAGPEDGVLFSAYVYGEDGTLVEDDPAAGDAGDVYMFRYTYDGQGRLTEEGNSHTLADGTMSTYDALYTYDEAGRIRQRLSGDNGELSYVTEYAYDEAGHMTGTRMCSALAIDYDDEGMPVVTEMSEPVNETSYTYDDQDRPAGTEVRMDGKPAVQTAYTYDEAPLLTLQHCTQQDYDEQGQALQETVQFFVAELKDAAGQTVLRFDLQGQPELTFDGAGYLTRAEAGGQVLTFEYEPAD